MSRGKWTGFLLYDKERKAPVQRQREWEQPGVEWKKLVEQRWDVVVVGAGPAGAAAAATAAQAGARVLLLEGRARVGEPLACAGFVPKMAYQDIDLPSRVIDQQVSHLVTHLPDGSVEEIASPGYMVDRPQLDRHLAARAVEAGATLRCQCRVLAREGQRLRVRHQGQQWTLSAEVILGCDGPHSLMGRSVGEVHRQLMPALQAEVLPRDHEKKVHVFFDREVRGGYVWLFPHNDRTYLGLGATDSERLQELLWRYVRRFAQQGWIDERGVLGISGGWIPIDEEPRRVVHERLLLVGDAAGQIDPVTGAGIHPAVACGELAGQAVARGDLPRYEKRYLQRFGSQLERARRKRQQLNRGWEQAELNALLRSCWMAFPQYYKDGP